MNIVTIIPARGGSRRVPGKNISDFHKKPLIHWTIDVAKKSSLINKVVVSTDCEETAAIAKKSGAEVPFIRPKKLATSKKGIEPVLMHAYEWLKKNENYHADIIVLMFATNPLKTPDIIDEAIKKMKRTRATSVVTVSEVLGNRNPEWLLKKHPDKKVTLSNGKSLKEIATRSQDLEKYYSRNDVAYIIKPENLYENPPNLYGDSVELFVMDEFHDGDINTPEDVHITIDKFKRLKKKTK